MGMAKRKGNEIKLRELLKCILPTDYVRIEEQLKVVGFGCPDDDSVKRHENKTVACISVASGELLISVFSK